MSARDATHSPVDGKTSRQYGNRFRVISGMERHARADYCERRHHPIPTHGITLLYLSRVYPRLGGGVAEVIPTVIRVRTLSGEEGKERRLKRGEGAKRRADPMELGLLVEG